jgi:hypothetical protein
MADLRRRTQLQAQIPEDGLGKAGSRIAGQRSLRALVGGDERTRSLFVPADLNEEQRVRVKTRLLEPDEDGAAVNLARSEEDVARRRQELGAVELKRASVEGRERAVAAKEEELAEREATLEERAQAVAGPWRSDAPVEVGLVFVPGERYRLVPISAELAPGAAFELEGDAFLVARIGPSPLPADARRCAYLVRGPRRAEPASGGSS